MAVRSRAGGAAQIVEYGWQRSVDVSCTGLPYTPRTLVINRESQVMRKLPLYAGRGLYHVRNVQLPIHLIDCPAQSDSLLRPERRQRRGVRNCGEEIRIPKDVLRLIDA